MSEKPIRKQGDNDRFFREAQTGHRNELKTDPAQDTAIHYGAGPCAVIAGPGSGKTFVLVQRIRYLIEEKGVDPSSILVLTFSRAAAAHMRRRFLHSCPHPETVFGTFHSVFLRILQESSREKYSLADPKAKQRYLQHLCDLRPAFLPEKTSPEELQLLISRFKNGLPCTQEWIPELIRTYDAYMQGRGWLDFDDMILRCQSLLMERPDILRMWRERFRWILVDEFQDVSPAQYQVLALLAAPADNLFIVGDDDQSIYGFRGADPLMMKRFLADFIHNREDAEEHTVFLTTNYRCAGSILEAAAGLIRHNKNRIDKNFRKGSSLQGAFSCKPFSDRRLEYRFVAEELAQMTEEERGRTAVIFRTHGAAQQFVQTLNEFGIPVPAAARGHRKNMVTDKTRILQDLAAYYRAAEGLEKGVKDAFSPKSAGRGTGCICREDLLRIMNRPERFLSGSFLPFEYMTREELTEHAGFEKNTVGELIRDLQVLHSLSPSFSMRYLLYSIGYGKYALSVYKEAGSILEQLHEEAAGFHSLSQWTVKLEEMLRASMQPAEEQRPSPDMRSAVQVLTMHACKGLEFDNVFIPDVNEGSIPSKRSWTPDQVEEERRLLYVAMTRARCSLTLTYLEGTADRPATPSRFLQPFLSPHGSGM